MKLLVVGDEHKTRRLLSFGVADGETEFTTITCPDDLDRLYDLGDYDVALLDWEMRSWKSHELIEAIRRSAPDLAIVALTANGDAGDVAKRHGAAACVFKPVDIDHLRATLKQYASVRPSRATTLPAAAPSLPHVSPANATKVDGAPESRSPAAELDPVEFSSGNAGMQRMLEIAWRVASTNTTVLILGENGTGKTELAKAIHRRSGRREMPFITVNCPCLQTQLLESELFGHVKGAFTGAVSDATGKVAAAEGGTLFLDEIGELPLEIQPKLLRLLQDREYERVGDSRARKTDIRVIAATNRDLKAEVKAGRFREDLYYRLNVISVEVLPLRHRPEDITPAAERFLASIGRTLRRSFRGFSPLAREAIAAFTWPGNLRELRNAVERAAILCDNEVLDLADFSDLTPQRDGILPQVGDFVSIEELEEAHIREVLARAATYDHAARILGIDKSTLYRKRKRHHGRIAKFPETAAEQVAAPERTGVVTAPSVISQVAG